MGLSTAEGKRQRRELDKLRAREFRKAQRAELASLRQAVRDAKRNRKGAMTEARAACRRGRVEVRGRIKEIIAEEKKRLAQVVTNMRVTAKMTCQNAIEHAKGLRSSHEKARGKLLAEREYRRSLKQIEAHNRGRRRELKAASSRERRQESDDEVRANIPPELAALFDRVGGRIKGSSRMSRTEAFLHYAEEHPGEVLESIDDITERVVRGLEAREKEARRALRRAVPRDLPPPAALAMGDEEPFWPY
jgi:hypothetical protein